MLVNEFFDVCNYCESRVEHNFIGPCQMCGAPLGREQVKLEERQVSQKEDYLWVSMLSSNTAMQFIAATKNGNKKHFSITINDFAHFPFGSGIFHREISDKIMSNFGLSDKEFCELFVKLT